MNMSEEEVYALLAAGKVKIKGLPDKKPEKQPEEPTNKFKNQKTVIDGIVFASGFEAERYSSLKLLEKAGAISNLRMQVPYELIPSFTHNGKKYRNCVYKADFVYIDNRDGHEIVEDTKGYVTKEYAIKKKLLLFKYPDMDFREVHKKPTTRKKKGSKKKSTFKTRKKK